MIPSPLVDVLATVPDDGQVVEDIHVYANWVLARAELVLIMGLTLINGTFHDDRAGFPTPERFPAARETVLGPYGEIAARMRLSRASYCVILTQGHVHDEAVLEQLLAMPALPYIGMIGSAAKVRHAFAQVRERGAEPDGRVYSPVGLALGGGLPADIALSILAEIRMLQAGGTGSHLRVPPV